MADAANGNVIGRIRDALSALGYKVPVAPRGAPGTPADLAAMEPAIRSFFTVLSADQRKALAEAKEPQRRAAMFAGLAEQMVARIGPGAVVAEALGILATGFMAYRATKKGADKIATLAGVADTITSAVFGRR